jgi:hypothetical protein
MLLKLRFVADSILPRSPLGPTITGAAEPNVTESRGDEFDLLRAVADLIRVHRQARRVVVTGLSGGSLTGSGCDSSEVSAVPFSGVAALKLP